MEPFCCMPVRSGAEAFPRDSTPCMMKGSDNTIVLGALTALPHGFINGRLGFNMQPQVSGTQLLFHRVFLDSGEHAGLFSGSQQTEGAEVAEAAGEEEAPEVVIGVKVGRQKRVVRRNSVGPNCNVFAIMFGMLIRR